MLYPVSPDLSTESRHTLHQNIHCSRVNSPASLFILKIEAQSNRKLNFNLPEISNSINFFPCDNSPPLIQYRQMVKLTVEEQIARHDKLSLTAKRRLSEDPEVRRQTMAARARSRWASKTPEERRKHAIMMRQAREKKATKKRATISE